MKPANKKLSLPDSSVSLCQTCMYSKVVRSARDNVFILCVLSQSDPSYAKYPRLPVLQCHGYKQLPATSAPAQS